MQNHEWRIYDVPPWRRIKLPNGRTAKLLERVLRRRAPDGSWQYREMTGNEEFEQQAREAW